MKKTLLALMLCLTVAMCLTGCVKRKMKKIVGIYELTTYSKSERNKETNSSDFTDLKTKYEYESYYIVSGNETGYYVEKSKFQDWTCYQVRCEYVYDEDKPKLVKSVNFKFKYPGISFIGQGRSESMSFNLYGSDADLRKSGLTDLFPATTTTVQYKRISSDTSLSKLFEIIGNQLPVLTYDLATYHGLFDTDTYDTKYDYLMFDIDTLSNKADVYYREKDGADQVRNDLDVVFPNGSVPEVLQIGEFKVTGGEYKYIELENLTSASTENKSFYPVSVEKGKTIQDFINETHPLPIIE